MTRFSRRWKIALNVKDIAKICLKLGDLELNKKVKQLKLKIQDSIGHFQNFVNKSLHQF